MFLSTECSLLRDEGFSCSLGILYGGLGISKLQFLIKKIEIKFPAKNFFQFFKPWIRIRDPDPESGSAVRKNAGSGSVSRSALNQCGSKTLLPAHATSYSFYSAVHYCSGERRKPDRKPQPLPYGLRNPYINFRIMPRNSTKMYVYEFGI
jgi:hypothetical protein